MEFGIEALYPQATLSSNLPANSLGLGIPPIGLSGSNRSDNGIFPLPTVGIVYRPCDSSLTYGLGFFAVGGFATNYSASTNNPILTPQPPKGLGLGPISADLQVYQMVPTVSWQVTERLSVGFAPTVSMAYLRADPFFVAPPDDANGDKFGTYPPGTHTRMTWGAGVQAGVYYKTDNGWHFGSSFKSPQWFETFRYNSTDELGNPRTLKFRLDYPLMVSAGTAYTGFPRWTLASDVRFIDYHNTAGFSQTGFDSNGAVKGVGWDSIFAVAVGAQYQATDCLSLRAGYSFNTNPIGSGVTSFNVASPLILQHTVYVGSSYQLAGNFLVSIAYAHAFENSEQGPILTPLGAIPGSSVQSKVYADTVMLGATVKF
jgi:long-chain fatty acid transport protein